MDTPAITELMPTAIHQRFENSAPEGGAGGPEKFSTWLQNSLSQVNAMQQSADESAQKLITGESEDVHGTMIALEKAGVAFNLVMQVRNKIVTAYEEIQRMQL